MLQATQRREPMKGPCPAPAAACRFPIGYPAADSKKLPIRRGLAAVLTPPSARQPFGRAGGESHDRQCPGRPRPGSAFCEVIERILGMSSPARAFELSERDLETGEREILVTGELDMAVSDQLREALQRSSGRRIRSSVLDVTGLTANGLVFENREAARLSGSAKS